MAELEDLEWRLSLIRVEVDRRRKNLAFVRARYAKDTEAGELRLKRKANALKSFELEESKLGRAIEYELAVKAGPWC